MLSDMVVRSSFEGRRWIAVSCCLKKTRFNPGTWYEVGVAFLNPSLAQQLLKEGEPIQLWEGKVIADGSIKSLFLTQVTVPLLLPSLSTTPKAKVAGPRSSPGRRCWGLKGLLAQAAMRGSD